MKLSTRSRYGLRALVAVARSPEEINLLDIIDSLEGSTELVPCVDDPLICNRSPDCPTRPIWTAATAQLRDIFGAMNLAAFLECPDESCGGTTLLQLNTAPQEPAS